MPGTIKHTTHPTRFRNVLQQMKRFTARPRVLHTALLILVVLAFVLSESLLGALAAQGDLDPTFGGGSGTMTADFGGNDQAFAMALQPDGKIVVVGQTNSDGDPNHTLSALARFNRDGLLDTTFGYGGQVITSLQPANYAYAVAVQADGKILTAGYGLADLTRYNSDGTLDTSFGNGGYTGTVIRADAIALLADGKILVGGYLDVSYHNSDFALARYNPDGTIDTSFGVGGKVSTEFLGGHDNIHALAIQSDGKIVAAGQSDCCGGYWFFALARYNSNGTIDTTFGNNGTVNTNLSPNDGNPYHRAYGVAVQADGKIIAVGGARHYGDTDSFAIVRYNPNGTLDSTFGSNGQVTNKFNGNASTAAAVALQRNGKFFVAGSANGFFALAHYNRDGSLDTDFGSAHNGQVLTQVFSSNTASAMALQPDGDVLLAGTTSLNNYDFAIARFQAKNANATAFDFNGDGKSDPSVFCPSDGNWRTLDSNGSINGRQWGLSSDKPVSGDFDGDGKTDVAVYRPGEGNWYIIKSSDGTVMLQNWGASADTPVPGDYDGDGKTDVAVYRPSEGNWYIRNSRDSSMTIKGWGTSTDIPVAGDYDGDGRADVAVYRPSEGNWYIITSADGFATIINWGTGTDKPVPADYDGDGRVDIAVYRPSEGTWYLRLWTNNVTVRGWGTSTDVPVPADYDGDGKADIAVWRPAEGTWYIINSSTNTMNTQYLGASGDVPVPSAYLPQ
jgi:uncharacterized delta-60 repeat protein